MQHQLSRKINSLPLSETFAMAARVRQLKSEGIDIISLILGEPDFNVPDFIKQAAIDAINENYNSYTPVDGYVELKEAVCRKLLRDNGLTYKPNQIVVSTGAKQSLVNAAMVLLNPEDEAILTAPYWVSYHAIIELCEATAVEIPGGVTQNFKITPAQLEAAISPKTKIIFLNSPNNPSGAVYTKEEYRALADVLVKYPNIFVISDEIYEHIIYEGKSFSFAAFEDMYDRTITINGLSKSFAMTGWRLGYLAAPEWIAKACNKMQGQITSGANCIAQRAAITALDAPVEKIQYMVKEFKKRRDLLLGLLNDIPGFITCKPPGAFYFLPDISFYFGKTLQGRTILNATDFSMFLLEVANVATLSGESFGAPNCIRISYATSIDLLTESIKRIKKAISESPLN
jgi:aspartate aminotransferase